jgi:hypothetical protein
MVLSKGLARLGLVVGVAAFMLAMGMAFHTTTVNAQTPPASFYGKGLKSGDKVEAFIGGKSCGSTTVNAATEWSIPVSATAACGPTQGAAVSFTLNGAPATVVPAAVWNGGGTPPDIANGYVLTAGVAVPTATAAAPAVSPPKTGNAGMLGAGSNAASGWMVLGIALVALGAVVGARRMSASKVR